MFDDEIDSRFIDVVAEYAQTCDVCGELTLNEMFAYVNPETQLGMCQDCYDRGEII